LAELLDLLHMPEAADGLVDYFPLHLRRTSRLGRVSGRYEQVADPHHADPLGPIASGGFPADVAARLKA
jgi:hypothetical protein